MSRRAEVDFEGFLDLAYKIDSLQAGALKKATENALVETDKYLTKETESAIASSKFNFERTGKTKDSLDKDPKVEWQGTKASAKVGFKLSEGGLASVFLTYGTPTITPDTNLKNAVKGEGKHKKRIQEIQMNEFNKVLEEAMRNG